MSILAQLTRKVIHDAKRFGTLSPLMAGLRDTVEDKSSPETLRVRLPSLSDS